MTDPTDTPDGLLIDAGGTARCWWCGDRDDYVRYHDEEWGRPVSDERHLFEKLCLEAFQAGLSWYTILRRRDGFRAAFEQFEPERVARFGPGDVERLLGDERIIRHRGKIEAVVHNAGLLPVVRERHGSLAELVWSLEPDQQERGTDHAAPAVRERTESEASRKLSRTLRDLGWKFLGPTTAYAFLQSMGVVNDHVEGCAFRQPCEKDRASFPRPSGGG